MPRKCQGMAVKSNFIWTNNNNLGKNVLKNYHLLGMPRGHPSWQPSYKHIVKESKQCHWMPDYLE